MSFKDGRQFSKNYKTQKGLIRSLEKSNGSGVVFTAEGKIASEMLFLIAKSAITVGSCVTVGSYFGPMGAAVGAIVGLALVSSVAIWYLYVKKNKDGTYTATYTPAPA